MKTRIHARPRLPVFQIAVLLIVVLAGIGLFLWLGPRTPVVAVPVTAEVAP